MGYMSAKEAGEKWGISQRRVAILCREDRIPGACMVGNMWIIPDDAQKPADARSERQEEAKGVKPFLKWAGGKSQLLKEIRPHYPFKENITRYVEPFVGGGAVLFDILGRYDLKEVIINDINEPLINAYHVVHDSPDDLIRILSKFQAGFHLMNEQERKDYYMSCRKRFNEISRQGPGGDSMTRILWAVYLIFLNHTCFNGLYRVNKKGEFNVPMGSYKRPLIYDEANLRAVSEKLQHVTILSGDYRQVESRVDENTFVYFDPPYRPLTDTANFNSYTNQNFGDKEQEELAGFAKSLAGKGAKVLISNSDPKNADPNDNFFDDLYEGFTIRRVEASRTISCCNKGRKKVTELLISSF